MVDRMVLMEQWIKLHLGMDGIPRETAFDSNGPWYREDVFFNGRTPNYRMLQDGKGKLTIAWPLTRIGYITPAAYTSKVRVAGVQSIVVWSRFPGDMGDIEEMHDRNQYLLVQVMRFYVHENVAPMGNRDATDAAAKLRQGYDKWEKAYYDYAQTFGLNWVEIPEFYKENVDAAINEKVEAWTNPDAVARRERARARRIAKQALELDKD